MRKDFMILVSKQTNQATKHWYRSPLYPSDGVTSYKQSYQSTQSWSNHLPIQEVPAAHFSDLQPRQGGTDTGLLTIRQNSFYLKTRAVVCRHNVVRNLWSCSVCTVVTLHTNLAFCRKQQTCPKTALLVNHVKKQEFSW